MRQARPIQRAEFSRQTSMGDKLRDTLPNLYI